MKPAIKKRFLVAVIGLIGICIFAVAAVYFWFQRTIDRSLPQTSGIVTLEAVGGKVEIFRDKFGVPHIYAQNESDLFFAMGYAAAQDRLWQMELYRRLGSGRLAEIFGEELLATDRFFRTLAAGRGEWAIPADLEFIPRRYLQGINAYRQSHTDRLPIEFKLLGYQPELWRLDDIIAVFRVLNWGLSFGWKVDLTAADILAKVGESRYREAFAVGHNTPLPPLSDTAEMLGRNGDFLAGVFDRVKKITGIAPSPASNNWVISGKKSITGKPLLANDTHMGLTNPSLWWQVHLTCPGFEVAGYTIPGLPGISVGHTRHVAWGITNVMVDDVDFYVEKLNPDNPHQYWYIDHWEKIKSIRQVIQVKDSEPVKTIIYLTRHGPVLPASISGSFNSQQTVAARWAVNEVSEPLRASYLMLKSKTAEDMIAALRTWQAPGQNFVFADSTGNIGYWCCAAIPIRAQGDGMLPAPGWTADYEWQGLVAFDEKPHMINPARGYIATANNRIAADAYPFFISNYWGPSDRVKRIRYLIEQQQRLSIRDMQRIQTEVFCRLASDIVARMIRVLEERPTYSRKEELLGFLENWDFNMSSESAAASLFEVTYNYMLENIFKGAMGPSLYRRYLDLMVFAPRALQAILHTDRSAWIDSGGNTMDDIVEKSLHQAVDRLESSLGDNTSGWTWGRQHTLTFEHVLGKRKPLNHIFNIGPYPVPGNQLTVNKKQYDYTNPYNTLVGASQRMIVDMSDPPASLHVLPTGQSGLLGSPHYRDQTALYLNGEYHQVWTDRRQLIDSGAEQLVLAPGNTRQ